MCKTIYNVCLQNTHVPKIFDRMMLFKQEFVVDGLNYSTIETLLLCICANQKDISITFVENTLMDVLHDKYVDSYLS